MKKIICCFLVFVMVLSLVACSNGKVKETTPNTGETTQKTEATTTAKTEATTTAKTEAAQKVKLTFLNPYQDPNQLNYIGYWFKMLEEWKIAHPNVEVDNQGISDTAVYNERTKAAFASNDLPNSLWTMGYIGLQEYVKPGYIVDLKPYFDADKEWYDSFQTGFFEGGMFTGGDGIYAVPFVGQVGGLYLNMKLLNDAGITKKPATMEELTITLDALVKQGKVIPFAIGAKNPESVVPILVSMISKMYGPNWIKDVSSGKAKYTDAIPLEAMKLIKQFQEKGYFGKSFLETDITGQRNAYYNMDTAMTQANGHIVAVAMAKSIAKDQIAYATWPYFEKYPQFEETFLTGVGDHWSICDTGTKEQKDLTMDFFKYCTTINNYQKNAEIQGYALMPVIKGVKMPAELPSMVKDFQDALKKMKNGNPPGAQHAFGAEASAILASNISDFLYGDITAEAAMKNTQDAIEKSLAAMNK